MILIAYILSTTLAIAIIAFSHTNLRMNAVSVAHGLVFGAVTLAALLTSPIPINSFIVGSQYFYIDHLAIYEVLITIVIFTLSAVYAGGYVESLIATGELEKGSLRLFYGAWSLLLLIVVLAFCSDNLALFWIFAEMTTIISAMLIAVLSAKENIDAAIKYIFIASTAMLFSFVGFIFLFEASREKLVEGTLNWTVLMHHASLFPTGMMITSFALVFIGFAAKSGIFPFNTWLPEAHAKAPSAVSAVLSGVLLNVGIYAIIRMLSLVHQNPAISIVSPFLMLFGILTIAIAAFSMLPQKNLKKLIAFSSIENMGLILIGLAIATPVAIFWVIFHIMAHSFTKASLFLSAGILHRQYHSKFSGDAPDEIRDVFRLQPLAAWGTIIGGLAIIGIPVFPVFFSKLFILLQLGAVSLWLLLAVLVLLFVAAAALGYFVIISFTQVSSPDVPPDIEPYVTPIGMKIPVVILIVIIVALGIFFPSQEISFISQIVTELRF
jgi:hydrogenase-4 component F